MNECQRCHGSSECQWECGGLENDIRSHLQQLQKQLNVVFQNCFMTLGSSQGTDGILTIRKLSWGLGL